jgi:hypothetical protein
MWRMADAGALILVAAIVATVALAACWMALSRPADNDGSEPAAHQSRRLLHRD